MHYRPHNYQQTATRFILDDDEAAILLGMGLGKSAITLTAIWELLLDYFTVSKVLGGSRCRHQARPAGGTRQVGDGDRHQPRKHPLARLPVG